MGSLNLWECNDCGMRFKANSGSLVFVDEYRCESCDRTKIVQKDKKFIKGCVCGGTYNTEVLPPCPSCRSRNHTVAEIIAIMD